MDPVALLRSAGSVARTAQLLERGLTRRTLAAAVQTGEIQQVQRGVFALPDAPPEFVAALTTNSLVTCASAARHYGLWLLHEPTAHHLTCPGGRCAPHLNHHRRRSVPVDRRLPVVGLVDVLIHALHCLPPVEAAVVVESSLRRGDTVRTFLLDRLQGNRNGKARAALELVSGCAESAIEVVARVMFRRTGYFVETQVRIDDVGRVDFVLEGFLVVEVDGDEFHSTREARNRDRRRNNELIARGYLYLRFGYGDVTFRRDDVLEQVRTVLSGRVVR